METTPVYGFAPAGRKRPRSARYQEAQAGKRQRIEDVKNGLKESIEEDVQESKEPTKKEIMIADLKKKLATLPNKEEIRKRLANPEWRAKLAAAEETPIVEPNEEVTNLVKQWLETSVENVADSVPKEQAADLPGQKTKISHENGTVVESKDQMAVLPAQSPKVANDKTPAVEVKKEVTILPPSKTVKKKRAPFETKREAAAKRSAEMRKILEDPIVESKKGSDALPKRSVAVDALPWNEVAMPDMFDDAEGFFGLEEVEGVEVVKEGGTFKFVSAWMKSFKDFLTRA